MDRQVTLYRIRSDAQRITVPVVSIGDTIRAVAEQAKSLPFAVDVLVNDKVLLPSDENRNLVPPPDAELVLVQNCSGDAVSIPNKSWRFE